MENINLRINEGNEIVENDLIYNESLVFGYQIGRLLNVIAQYLMIVATVSLTVQVMSFCFYYPYKNNPAFSCKLGSKINIGSRILIIF